MSLARQISEPLSGDPRGLVSDYRLNQGLDMVTQLLSKNRIGEKYPDKRKLASANSDKDRTGLP